MIFVTLGQIVRTCRPAMRLPALVLLALPWLSGCSTLTYYGHLTVGEMGLLMARQPIDQLIADPQTNPQLRQRLRTARQARAFASDRLKLPRNDSYLSYVDIGRPYVMYNVFATPAWSLQPIRHCFLFAGCVAYQGFYSLQRARAEAERLRQRGDDVYIGGVPAYSTLGHFDDPIVSSMNRWSVDELVGTIFHELAHQELYVKGDTAFNESFASFVASEGLRQWRKASHRPPPDPGPAQRDRQFIELVLATRKRLRKVYAEASSIQARRQGKQAAFAWLRERYRQLRDGPWQGHDDHAAWIRAPLNNAKLLPFGLYDQYQPAFARLFHRCGDDWAGLYQHVRAIAEQGPKARLAFLGADPHQGG